MAVKLYQHQEEDLLALRAHSSYGLWHEVGAGKTFPLSFRMLEDLMQHPGGMWIVVAEAGPLLEQWKEEIETCNQGALDLNIQILTGGLRVHKKKAIERTPPDILLINYEYFPKCENWLTVHALGGKIRGMIFDEAHRMKGFRGMRSKYAKRTKSIVRVAHARYGRKDDILRYLATGSPIVNPDSPDIWGIYYVMDPEIMGRTLWRFEKEFFYDVAHGQPYKKLKLKPNMKEELSRRMYGRARRLLVDELPVDFPQDTWMEYPVEMSASLRKQYTELLAESVMEHDGVQITRPEVLSRLMALQQLASGFLIERPNLLDREDFFDLGFDSEDGEVEPERKILHIDSRHKDRQLWRIIDEIGRETQCIVWAHFKHELAHIDEMLRSEGLLTAPVYGDITKSQKIENIKRFKAGELHWLVAHPASAGAGLNLQMAGHSIRYGRSYRPLDFIQSTGRIKRPNSKHGRVVYHEIYTAASSDEQVYQRLRENKDLSSELTLDHIRSMRA